MAPNGESKGPAHEAEWDKFLNGGKGKISLINYKVRVFPPNEIVERAKNNLQYFKRYSVRRKNCQHFASHCTTGERQSHDIEKIHKMVQFLPARIIPILRSVP